MKNVYIVLFKNFTALDVFGPVQVLNYVDEYKLHYISLDGGIVENEQNIRIETEPFSVVEAGGIVLIPGGGGTREEVNHEEFLSALAKHAEAAEYVLCVCTGSALLAKTGLLDGKNATSNKKAFDWVKSCGKNVKWNSYARWVVDGNIYTSAGVSAGTDMALGFVQDRFGREKAVEICERMEYYWNENKDIESDEKSKGDAMSLQFLKADIADAAALVGISSLAFDSDVNVGGAIVL